MIWTAALLYAVHGLTHVARYFGCYYGGGTPVASRPRQMELRDALQLLAPALGWLLFSI